MQPDKTDWQIMDIISNEKVSNSSIAKRLGLSEGAIRQRLRKLKDSGILRVKGLINPEVIANQQLAFVAISISESRLLDQTAERISQLANVQSVSIVSGRYDVIAEVLVDSNKGLVVFLTQELSQIENIANTETFLILKSYRKYV